MGGAGGGVFLYDHCGGVDICVCKMLNKSLNVWRLAGALCVCMSSRVGQLLCNLCASPRLSRVRTVCDGFACVTVRRTGWFLIMGFTVQLVLKGGGGVACKY